MNTWWEHWQHGSQWENTQSKQSLTRLQSHPFQIHKAKFPSTFEVSLLGAGNEFTHIRDRRKSATYAVLTEEKVPTTPPTHSCMYINTL